ncbi:MAG: polymer-forming cytoskeletal protein [Chthoniobacterales bacterium]
MAMFTSRKQEPATPASEPPLPRPAGPDSNRAPSASAQPGGLLSGGVSIKGSVKFRNSLLIDGQVEGEIDSTGALTIGEHAKIQGTIRAKSVTVHGTIDGNIFASERCELGAGCTLRGDIEAPRLVVDENATFLGSAKIATK